jgi:hypothetical protein
MANLVVLALALVVVGAAFNNQPVFLLGAGAAVLAFILATLTPRPRPALAVPGGRRVKHKLLQAPQDAWEQDDFWPYFMMQGGPHALAGSAGHRILGGFAPGRTFGADPLGRVDEAMLARARGLHPSNELAAQALAYRVRDFLPFPGYGRTNPMDTILTAFPISLGGLLGPFGPR